MDIKEYKKIEKMKYLEYCDYLQKKYGFKKSAYMTKGWSKNQNCSRTKEGLMVHHIHENEAILLSSPRFAQNYPYEWQMQQNLVYCDLLEHLLLHILICEETIMEDGRPSMIGVGGITAFIVPELNDAYSGFKSNQAYRINWYNAIINDKDVYFILLKRFIYGFCINADYHPSLLTSLNANYGVWKKENNAKIFEEINNL